MKTTHGIITLAATAFIMAGLMSSVTSHAMVTEDDMLDGIINSSVPVDTTRYTYDKSIDTPGEFMAEAHLTEEAENIAHFAGDSSAPTPEAMMTEESIFADTKPNLSSMLNKYGAPAAGGKK